MRENWKDDGREISKINVAGKNNDTTGGITKIVIIIKKYISMQQYVIGI